MNGRPFRLQIAGPSRYSLGREGEAWSEEFASIHDVLAFAAAQPDSEGSTIVVRDAQGGEFLNIRL